jgi:hypothetical protein
MLLMLNTSTIQPLSPLHTLNTDHTSIPVVYLTLKLAELQDKVLTAAEESETTLSPLESLDEFFEGEEIHKYIKVTFNSLEFPLHLH